MEDFSMPTSPSSISVSVRTTPSSLSASSGRVAKSRHSGASRSIGDTPSPSRIPERRNCRRWKTESRSIPGSAKRSHLRDSDTKSCRSTTMIVNPFSLSNYRSSDRDRHGAISTATVIRIFSWRELPGSQVRSSATGQVQVRAKCFWPRILRRFLPKMPGLKIWVPSSSTATVTAISISMSSAAGSNVRLIRRSCRTAFT